DHQFKLIRLHDWNIRRLGTLEDATGIDPSLTIAVRQIRTIADQTATLCKITQSIGCWNFVKRRQLDQLDAPSNKERGKCDEQTVGSVTLDAFESGIDLASSVGIEDLILYSNAASSRLHVAQRQLSILHIQRIDKHGHPHHSPHNLTQKLQPLCRQLD